MRLKRHIAILTLALSALCGTPEVRAQHTLGVIAGYGMGTGRFQPKQEMRAVWGLYSGGLTWRYYGSQRVVGAFGLDLEFRHPKFHPTWITDANGNIDEAKIRTYWEEQLNSFLSWEELKKYVIDPLEDHSLLIRSTDEYDPNSVMTWPFY